MASAGRDIAPVPMQLVRDCLVASVQVEMGDDELRMFQHDLLVRIRDTRARAVILDLSGISILDCTDFDSMVRTLKMASILGAYPVIVGLRSGIASALAELGVSEAGIATCLSLERAFERIESHRRLGRARDVAP